MMRLDRLLANLGYCTRKEVQKLIKQGRVTVDDETPRSGAVKVEHHQVRLDEQSLDPPQGMVVMLHKPAGYACSHDDHPPLVYSLLPERWNRRRPKLSSIGRLDRDTTGLILFTDDGALNHRLTSPRSHVSKRYRVKVEAPLQEEHLELFRDGGLVLEGDTKPLKPAKAERVTPHELLLTLTEGRHHQVKRMLEAVGNRVVSLHRDRFAHLALELESGQFQLLDEVNL